METSIRGLVTKAGVSIDESVWASKLTWEAPLCEEPGGMSGMFHVSVEVEGRGSWLYLMRTPGDTAVKAHVEVLGLMELEAGFNGVGCEL